MRLRCTHPLMSFSKEKTMSPSLKVVIPSVAGFMIAVSAQAQLLLTWESHIILSQQDLDMIHGAVTNQVHGKTAGTAAPWSNPASGNSGPIRLVKKLARQNQQCEDIEYTVRSGGRPIYTEHYRLTSCLQPDGTWKIAWSLARISPGSEERHSTQHEHGRQVRSHGSY
jgi:surface antigen